ncbi:Asp-tRNA(Asn)/Glu-tRNA(Gln) amidotransferase subunit GatB [Clostridium thermosuccinogenes]|uniref:Asp-tRNA(Asn)/Glu-tRNA(Gln) amidotransferase subunit GatB n=1 Tax=Clostridium thermosuccinogenes TaxID=84032 RepID=UPI000CCC4471|nr:Asp-tRNA(Asn)/Glu-tRNA(Gln) amidotransferase subunit GatB [Pseudoclostridium thermosuccinogenes]PNT91433.1 Asp-tRNA(Asn)/Glu-tRNA(Gln) amidotransferase GatCAB subunit B [Pseudoclostridium thermosuccinogenes]
MRYIPVIGLEIHAELSTSSKVFCTCSAQFGGEQNTRCCPRCAGLPGTLPVLNKKAVEYAVKAGLSLDCAINMYNSFDRKNYFYPDLPKAYQITQFDKPVCINGGVDIGGKIIRINRIHLEEDAGKLIHDDFEGISLADFNRCGVPLIEIVTEPDISSAEEARAFVEAVSLRLRYAGVCDCKMEEGSLRVDVNISIMPEGSAQLGTRAEIKNLNSLKSIVRAIEYEISRQSEILDSGGKVVQETRRFNDNRGTTNALRSKEEAHDYRYFPEPDIPAVVFTEEDIKNIKASLPKMPQKRFEEYTKDFGLSEDDARLIISDKALSDFYDNAVAEYPNYKGIANFILVELLHQLNKNEASIDSLAFSPSEIAQLVRLSDESKISKNAAKDILRIMFEKGGKPEVIAKENGFLMDTNVDAVIAAIKEVMDQNQKAVDEYKAGSEKVFGFLMGQVTRKLGKGSNPKIIREELTKALKGG